MSIVLLLVFGFLFYAPTLFYGYVNDDVVVSNEPKKETGWFKQIIAEWRGIAYYNKTRSHLIMVLMHLTVVYLIYSVFGSLLASALFLVNPINYQGGLWLSGKFYTRAGIGALLVMKLPLLYILLMPYTAFALWGVPFVFLMKQQTLWAMLPFLALAIYWKKCVGHKWDKPHAVNEDMREITLSKLIPFFKTFGYYTTLALLPFRLGMYHAFIYGVGVNKEYNKTAYKIDKFFFYGLVLFFLDLWLMVVNFGNPLGIGLLWWTACIVQWCNFVTCQQHIAERYVYVANIGLMLALASLIGSYPYVITALLVYYITRNLSYRKAYIDDARLLEHNIFEIDDAHYAWMLRGIMAFKGREFWSAFRYFMSAKFLMYHDFKVNFNLAQAKIFLKQYNDVEDLIQYAEKYKLGNLDIKEIDRIKTMLERSKNGQSIKSSEMVFCM